MLAGFADGTVCRVDPATLALTEILRLEGKPQWVAERAAEGAAASLVAVVEKSRHVDLERYHGPMPYWMVQEPATGKSFALEKHATAFFLDSKGRVWIGADEGEWGGWVSVCDPATGTLRSIPGRKIYEHKPDKEFWLGVMGFFERHDGQVWAYGGTTHMGITDGYIWRVDRGRAEEVYFLDNIPPSRKQELKRAMAAAKARAEEAKEKTAAKAREAKEAKPKGTSTPSKEKHRSEIPAEIDEPLPKVDRDKKFGDDAKPEPEPLPADRPYLPITHIIERARTHELLILSFSDLFQTDENVKRWKKVHELDIRYRGGRRDAVGTYPSVHGVHFLEGTNQLILGTRLDGFVRLDGNKETSAALSGQLEVESIDRIENTREGMLIIESDEGDAPWQLQNGKWTERDFAPSFQAVKKAIKTDPEEENDSWSRTCLLVGPDGMLFTLSASSSWPGLRAAARWRNGKAEILEQAEAQWNPESGFVTPDGSLWNVGSDGLLKLTNRKWEVVAAWDEKANGGKPISPDWGARAVNAGGPPWILLNRRPGRLIRMQPAPRGNEPPFAAVPIRDREGERELEVFDATSWDKDTLLLATDLGLRMFATASGKLTSPPSPLPGRQIKRLCRDGLGRLWLSGQGLLMIDPDRKTVHAFDAVPMLGRSPIDALAADPAHPDGVVAAMEERGLIFVQARSIP